MEPTTVSKFEIIGSFVVHLYFNEFFIQAKKLYTNKVYPSVLESYKNILCDYSQFVKTPKFFKNIIMGINMNCATVTIYNSMNENECIAFMAKEFIPTNIFDTVTFDNKKSILNIILTNCLLHFSQDVIINHLDLIVNNRSEQTVSVLQDLFLKIIKMEKDKMFSKFINPSPNTVPVKLFNSVQKKIIELTKIKKELINCNNKLADDNKLLTEKINKLLQDAGSNNQKNNSFEEANIKLMQMITNLNNTIANNSKTIDSLKTQLTDAHLQIEKHNSLDDMNIFVPTNQANVPTNQVTISNSDQNEQSSKLKDITSSFDYNDSASFTSNLEFDNEDDE